MSNFTRQAAGLIVLVVALILAACGGKQSVASKSAAAYREAVAKGIPVESGGHGGHQAETSTAHDEMAGMDHSQMQQGSTSKMAGMEYGSMAGMDHAKMQHGSTSSMAGMEHGSMAGMDHAKMQHGSTSNMAGMEHGSMAGMEHSQMQHGSMKNMPAMQHGTAATTTVTPAPTTSSGLAQLNPAATLSGDEFDQPAPAAVSEANKAGGSSRQTNMQPQPPNHSGHDHGSRQ